MDIEVARGTQVRARVRWVEEGELSSTFFLRLEKKRAAHRSVAALRTNDGSIVSHNNDLCRGFCPLISLCLLLRLPILF